VRELPRLAFERLRLHAARSELQLLCDRDDGFDLLFGAVLILPERFGGGEPPLGRHAFPQL
jgi:hypothetical protein